MAAVPALLTVMSLLAGGPSSDRTLAIDVRTPGWVGTGLVAVAIRNQSDSDICLGEVLTDVRRVSLWRRGREIDGNPAMPFIGYRGPSCRTLPPGELVTFEVDVTFWQPDRKLLDRVCYTASFSNPEGRFREMTACSVDR